MRTLKRKQVIPVSRGNIQCKYINVADENKKKSICTTAKNKGSLLAKIKFMSGEQRNILSNDLFNQELERLKGRIEQVECTRTHEDIVRTSLKWLSELEKDMNALMDPGGSHPSSSVLMWDADGQMGINACLETNG
ncbi:uncharacterized protein LOC121669129 isoform X2 [Corvus kubaryi]|uniref:uncharacterized protein LOC121669129 isoform X2 n=1 Tax=Corvus kubaryi TaxID=68294 RepID=UPI001C03E8C5|nr:uncharacterized protein LOC121669129 isoform X2 [Corvus kubaryi]